MKHASDEDDEDLPKFKVYSMLDMEEMKKKKKQEKLQQQQQQQGQKKKATRVWFDPEYERIRTGGMLSEDPDACLSDLQERTLTIFRHKDPTVEFAAEPKRPKWKGVFRMHPDMGYGPDEYYNPKQEHLGQIYKSFFPKKNQPANNIVVHRDGTEMPYWVDDWQHVKNNDKKHKKTSIERKAATAPPGGGKKKAAQARISTATKTVIPTDGVRLFPIEGWMYTHSVAKGAATSPIMRQALLRASTAKELSRDISIFVQQLASGPENIAPPATLDDLKKQELKKNLLEEIWEEEEIVEPPEEKTNELKRPPPLREEAPPVKKVHFAPPTGGTTPNPVITTTGAPLGDFAVTLRARKSRYIANMYAAFERGERAVPFEITDPEELLSDFVKFASHGT